jgi:Do/DeqQ family serine protease
MGSGVIISDDGYIVTNNHVVNGASKISVTLNNNKSYSAKLIGADEGTDIAVLKIEAKGLPAIPMGNSDDVKIGEWVLAVGNPFNLNSTVTAGIVSAKSRNINILHGDDNHVFPIESFIQTDAAVNPGNSGGALVNSRGELIGINTAIASTTGSYSGYSFAVPVNLTQKVTGDLIRYGVVQRGFLGVNIRNIDQDLANEIGVDNLDGVYVGGLIEGGAGQKAGVEAGDIIVGVGPVSVKTVPELQEQIARFRPGDVVQLRIKRGNKDMLVPVTLLNQDGETGVVKKEIPEVKDALGASFSSLTKAEMAKYRVSGGVKIASIGNGRLRSAGLKQGFIITKVDNISIENVDQLIKILEKKKGQVAIEGIFPNGSRGMFSFPL